MRSASAADLAELSQLGVQVSKRRLQHLTVARIAAGFQLLQDLCASECQARFLALVFKLLCVQAGLGVRWFFVSRFHLSFYCFAFPTPGHDFIIRPESSWNT